MASLLASSEIIHIYKKRLLYLAAVGEVLDTARYLVVVGAVKRVQRKL